MKLTKMALLSFSLTLLPAVTMAATPKVGGKTAKGAKTAAKATKTVATKTMDTTTAASTAVANGFTGLIVDARHLNLNRSVCPKIFNAQGTEVFGTVPIKSHSGDKGLDLDEVIENGIVAYETNLDQAKENLRVGPNCMVIKAEKTDKFHESVFLTDEDAAKVVDADKKSAFLKKMAVIFVK